MATQDKILIVDDSEINRAILADMIGQTYSLEYAADGKEAVGRLEQDSSSVSMVLLDLVMPEMNGFEVLSWMKKRNMTETIPVVVISSETDFREIERAYDLGAIDFVSRPFDERIVLCRIYNTLALYRKKAHLENLVVRQIFEKEKNNHVMIDLLANVIEFHNGETGNHILNIRSLTSIILHQIPSVAPQLRYSAEMIMNIVNASALHDIGKNSIPSEIINKPGRLTDEEFAIMKTHSAIGADILKESPYYNESELVKIAHNICRWHHERWDGRGYPDRLSGDDIPLYVQVVSLADVYDALISKRVYKPAYPHKKAIEMIVNGECGQFNPVIIECLKKVAPMLENGLDKAYLDNLENVEIRQMAAKFLSEI